MAMFTWPERKSDFSSGFWPTSTMVNTGVENRFLQFGQTTDAVW
jgi:hypothetical protein